MAQKKYNYLAVIQQHFGQGWEDVSEYDQPKTRQDRELIKHDLREYRLTGYPTRLINRRELNQTPPTP